jgi:transcriptional regulator with XRE-family HTH domain
MAIRRRRKMNKIEELKARKRELNMTYEELAQLSGIPLRTCENIFHGVTKNPRIDTMQAIERALGFGEPKAEISEEERELVALISQLTEEETLELSNYIDYILSKRK